MSTALSELVTFESPPVKECRANCTKRCCINCEHFLSATVSRSMRGMLLDMVCDCFLHCSADMFVGVSKCTKYIPPKSKNR
jgi:hypothetical protein